MKKEDGAGVDSVGTVGMTTTRLIDIDPLWQRTALRVGAVPTVGEVGGVEKVDTKTIEDIEAIAVGKG